MRAQNKVAIITGGTGGIGSETARLLAREGATVVITDLDEVGGKTLADEVGGAFYRLNVTDHAAWETLVDDVVKRYGGIDILVQCAGIEGDLKVDVLDTSPDLWERVIAINLTGTFYGCKAVMPAMLAKKSGSIILLSSIVSYMAAMSAAPYGVSKAGVQHLAKTMALVGARNGAKVRVNSIHPGLIKTRMTDNIIKELADVGEISEEQVEASMVGEVPFGERGTPSDIASLILYLASDESRYMTGSDVKIDGGWLIKDATS
ncbi:SDR family NAD(P)-dependent oxidoreductase [Paraburkholderia sediminicola]|uniref:SDR family NAD(P)-dependent oxidoreductase n=1 Tax=Paraburkholderia sediminicola TaxID=458836 RepID=UPI0038BB770B